MNYPSKLFKYQGFRSYSKEMLETGYIYFCPANELDDLFECAVTIAKEIMNGDRIEYAKNLFPFIENLIKPYCSHNVESSEILECYEDGVLDSNKFINLIKERDNSINEDSLNKGFEFIKKFEKLEEEFPQFKDSFESLYKLADNVGIFSLSEEYNNQVMWVMYADSNKGFCIEYDIDKYLNEKPNMRHSLKHVEYSDLRNNDPIKIIIKDFYSSIFKSLGLAVKEYDIKNAISKIACTKNTDWSFQKEWRFIGNPKQDGVYIPIKAIYLGKKIDEKVKTIILDIAKDKKYNIYQQEIDLERNNFKYNLIFKAGD